MTIIYLCHYFAPEIGAPSARILEMSREWVKAGHTVKVVTCFPNHPTGIIPPEYRGKRFMRETMDGIEVYRNWVYATPNEGFVKKTLGHLSFMVSSVLLSSRRVGKADVLIVSSPTLFSVISAWLISRLKRIPYVFEVRDLWPAAIVDLGVLKEGWVVRALERMEMALYRRAAAVVNVTRSFCDELERRGVPRRKLFTITNGVDTDRYRPDIDGGRFRREHGLEGKCVVLYTGAHGISQALGSVLDAAERLRHRSDLQFVFIGEGAEKAQLVRSAEERGLTNVLFLPSVKKDRMAEIYAASDICLVPLRDIPLFRTFIPSKMFEIMSAGRPIVASLEGEAAAILEDSGGAIVTSPENGVGIADAIARLADQPSLRAKFGENGRSFVLRHYTRRKLAADYIGILEAVKGAPTREGALT